MSTAATIATIMIVADTPANLQLLETMLVEHDYRVLSFPRGEMALTAAQKNPPDLVLLDITMPGMDGYQFCSELKKSRELCDIPVIFLSGLNEPFDKIKAFQVGGVDYITKPFHLEEVQIRLKTHLKLHRLQQEAQRHNRSLKELVAAYSDEIIASQMATIFALARLAESRDDDTGKHLDRVQAYSRLLAERLAEDSPYRDEITQEFIENLHLASPLHDIGKVAIPDGILLKMGKLSAEEFEVMKQHTTIGARTLASVLDKYPQNVFIRTGLTIARSHHERWDGSGYPDGTKGTEISLYARVMALVDVYDALCSKRCYRGPLPHDESYRMIVEGSGSHFDPAIVAAFVSIADQFLAVSRKTLSG